MHGLLQHRPSAPPASAPFSTHPSAPPASAPFFSTTCLAAPPFSALPSTSSFSTQLQHPPSAHPASAPQAHRWRVGAAARRGATKHPRFCPHSANTLAHATAHFPFGRCAFPRTPTCVRNMRAARSLEALGTWSGKEVDVRLLVGVADWCESSIHVAKAANLGGVKWETNVRILLGS